MLLLFLWRLDFPCSKTYLTPKRSVHTVVPNCCSVREPIQDHWQGHCEGVTPHSSAGPEPWSLRTGVTVMLGWKHAVLHGVCVHTRTYVYTLMDNVEKFRWDVEDIAFVCGTLNKQDVQCVRKADWFLSFTALSVRPCLSLIETEAVFMLFLVTLKC